MPVTEFVLYTQRGTTFSVNDFKNKWTFLFFGYTNCPDICPTTLTELTQLAKQLDSSTPATSSENHQQSTTSTIVNTTAEVQYVFVTVDPQRDTQEHLAGYLNYFNQDFIGLTGSMNDIEQLAGQLKIKHARGEGSNDNYTVNHSSAILLIDPQGRYYAKFSAPHYAETMRSKFFLIKQHFHRFS
ncbi:SCO family protein [Kaarinaea lacus]